MTRIVILLVLTGFVASTRAAVNLEWRPENNGAHVGDTIRVGLYAVADNGPAGERFSLAQALIFWDPSFLALLGHDDNGPYQWMISDFPDDSGLDGLNNTFADGNAFYEAWRKLFSGPPVASPEGLLITTFEFQALAPTGGTVLRILSSYGQYSVTAVYDDEYGGWNIVNNLGEISIGVAEDQWSGGDLDCDGLVGGLDVAPFIWAWLDPQAYSSAFPTCRRMSADVNLDGQVDALDVAPFVALLVSGAAPGDMNCDGAVNLQDLPGFVQALVRGPGEAAIRDGDPGPPCARVLADLNKDGFVDGRDIQFFVELLQSSR